MPDPEVGADLGAGAATATVPPAPVAPAQPGELAATPASSLPATAPQIPLEDQVLKQQSYGSKLYHGILSGLGGSQDITFERDPNTGKMITHATPSTPGTQWKRIIAGALTGFAGAQAAGTQGPGGTLRGFAGGIQAGSQAALQNRQRARTEADEDYKTKLETARSQLENSLHQQQIVESAFRVQTLTREAQDRDLENYNSFEQAIGEAGAGAEMVGAFHEAADLRKFLTDHPEIMARHANGYVRAMPNIVNGERKGIIGAVVTPGFLDTPIGHSMPIFQHQTVPGKDGKPEDQWIRADVTPETKWGDYLKALGDTQKESDDHVFKQAQTKNVEAEAAAIPQETRARLTEAAAHMMSATTDQSKAASEIALNNAKAAAEYDKVAEVEYGPGGAKGFNTWHKEMVEPALAVEQIYRMSSKVYNEYEELRKQGKDFPSGAQSVQMLSNHIAGTFGNVKGGRITKDLIEKHLGARSVSDTLQVAIQRLTTGNVLSPKQWDAFFQMVNDRRNETWQAVLDDGKAEGRPLQYVAFPDDVRRNNRIPSRVAPAENTFQQPAAQTPGAAAPVTGGAAQAPPANLLKEGINTKFGNGQTWTLKNGQPVQVGK